MIIVKKWFAVRNTLTAINTSVSKVVKLLAGAISHLLIHCVTLEKNIR